MVQRIEVQPHRGMIYDRNGDFLVYNVPIYDLMVTPKAIKNLDTLALCQDFGINLQTFNKALEKAKNYSYLRSSVFIKDIDHQTLASVQDRLIEYRGFGIKAHTVRSYPYPILANTLGYLGEISAAQLAADTEHYYSQSDLIGISGLEKYYEPLLRGRRGCQYVITDVKGQEKGNFKGGALDVLATPGQDLTITIDRELQYYGEQIMKDKIGSIVAIQPSTGEILAMISSPSYDPNLLIGKNLRTYYADLEKNKISPLFHRAIMAMYPPGSIFKLVQALVALQEQLITPGTMYACNKNLVNCRNHPSPTNLHQAIQYSCNPYFYHVFRRIINQNLSKNVFEDTRIGLENWLSYVKQFGLNKPLGIDLPNEKSGFLPDVKFYDTRYGKYAWKASTIRSLDIGQGEILITPLQMANLAAIMANRGYYYRPHLIKRIGEKALTSHDFIKHEVAIDKAHFDTVVYAMQDVVANGPAWRAKVKDLSICAKTGTAENPHGADHSVFMGFSPLETPEIAIAVYVENAGWGSRAAAAVAGLMIEKYIKRKVERKEMENFVLKGNFLY